MNQAGVVRFASEYYGAQVDPRHRALLTRSERSSMGGRIAAGRAASLVATKVAFLRLLADTSAERARAYGVEPDVDWGAVEVLRQERGSPAVRVRGESVRCEVSVSHASGLAVAAVSWSTSDGTT